MERSRNGRKAETRSKASSAGVSNPRARQRALAIGITTGKALALARRLPFLAINHLEAHALTAGLTDGVLFPYLLLLVSGGFFASSMGRGR